MPRNLDHRVELAVPIEAAGAARRAARHAGTRLRRQPELMGARRRGRLAPALAGPRRAAAQPAAGAGRAATRARAAAERPRRERRRSRRRRAGRAAAATLQRRGGGQRVERGLELVHRLVVEPEQVVVAVAHDPLLVDHDHRALGARAATRRRCRPCATALSTSASSGTLSACLATNASCEARSCEEMPTTVAFSAREVLGAVAVGAELFRADHRVVARIEQQHDALAAMLGEPERAVRARQLEVRRLLADLRGLGHARASCRCGCRRGAGA